MNWKEDLKNVIEEDFKQYPEDYEDDINTRSNIELCLMGEGLEVFKDWDYAYEYCQEKTVHEVTVESYEFWGSSFKVEEPMNNKIEEDFFDITINKSTYRINRMTCQDVEAYYVKLK